MIIVRSPLRITLGGGGTDLPSYYRSYEGFCMSAAINQYIYVALARPLTKGICLRYSAIEKSSTIDGIQDAITREALRLPHLTTNQIEVTSLADVPAGTGLGSSSSFTVGLLTALHVHSHQLFSPKVLAECACFIEIDRLGAPCGKQDQYIAAHGGLTCFTFHRNDQVTANPLALSKETRLDLEDNLLLFFTGHLRQASQILRVQNDRTQEGDETMLQNLHLMKQLAYRSKEALEKGDLLCFGELMHEHWSHKKQRLKEMSCEQIDDWYHLALKNGAIGGKLVGAGGGGFLLFYATDRCKLRHVLGQAGLEEVRFRFDFEGVKVIAS